VGRKSLNTSIRYNIFYDEKIYNLIFIGKTIIVKIIFSILISVKICGIDDNFRQKDKIKIYDTKTDV